MNLFVVGALLCALVADPTHDQSSTKNDAASGRSDEAQQGSAPPGTSTDAAHRGSRGESAGGAGRAGAPGPGLETGPGNAMGGGRTDVGPEGSTGITGEKNDRHERKRARRNSQARGRNPKGSLSRPADTPAQINRDPKPMGSGAPMTPVSQEPQPGGRNYDAGPQPGAAGGVASDTGPTSPGAAATTGTAGKAAEPKQDEKK